MSVQDTVRTVTVPRQAGPADPPLAPAPPAPAAQPAPPAPVLGRDRPMTADERQMLIGLACVLVVLSTIIVTFLLLAQYVWT